MKDLHDLVRGWLGKAESDLVTVELCLARLPAEVAPANWESDDRLRTDEGYPRN